MRQQVNDDINNTPGEQTALSDQIKLAVQLQEQDARRLQAVRERLAATEAAGEMGIPVAYMEQAATALAARHAARAKRRRRQVSAVLGSAAAVVILGTWSITHRHAAPPPPMLFSFAPAFQGQWHLDSVYAGHPDKQLSLSFPLEQGHSVALVKVHSLPRTPEPQVDLDTNQIPRSLAGYHTVSFRVRGQGLGQIRLFLQNGEERWCSPFLTASGDWHTVRVPLSRFLHQRVPARYNPQHAPYTAPGAIGQIAFKLGQDANAEDAHGEVAIDDLRFK